MGNFLFRWAVQKFKTDSICPRPPDMLKNAAAPLFGGRLPLGWLGLVTRQALNPACRPAASHLFHSETPPPSSSASTSTASADSEDKGSRSGPASGSESAGACYADRRAVEVKLRREERSLAVRHSCRPARTENGEERQSPISAEASATAHV